MNILGVYVLISAYFQVQQRVVYSSSMVATLNRTSADLGVERFQRILQRKKRFLLFPPGAAIVTTLSFTKTLVPRSPSGINMIGECDIFFPLQTKIADWYPTTTTKKPPPPPPSDDDYNDAEDDNKGVLPANVGPVGPQLTPPAPPLALHPVGPLSEPAPSVQSQNPPISAAPFPPPQPMQDFNQADNGNRLPTDQEIGITQGTLISDPNFNVGKHPGEIYVENEKSSKNTSRRYNSFGYYSNDAFEKRLPWAPNSASNYAQFNRNEKFDSSSAELMDENELWQSMTNIGDQLIHPPSTIIHSKSNQQRKWQQSDQYYGRQKGNNSRDNRLRYGRETNVAEEKLDELSDAIITKQKWKNEKEVFNHARERRDIYDQLETFISFKQFDTKSCILRMICEAKHYLLPPGKSLFQDIFRVLFTLPLESDVNDEYSKAMQSTERDCQTDYAKRCKYSILGYLMSNERPIL